MAWTAALTISCTGSKVAERKKSSAKPAALFASLECCVPAISKEPSRDIFVASRIIYLKNPRNGMKNRKERDMLKCKQMNPQTASFLA
ncbi:hypothetical protein ANCCEY_07526 [Ancylostoma ceylanicum]|uniref:Uncharacterized protein n=1 Tax=Ancylostoma ceylanicum TaxID=53326 RepID=A0A0D6LTK0_9BILA|nr:hypothetical protein ANCCEY_07526 [Ancylostoma ceylanicum]